MFDGRRILVVVPARGGSTGVRLKNLREVGGVPLVTRAAHVVRALPWVDRAVVSTDHPGIAAVAEQGGLSCPFIRPEDISGAIVSDWQVLFHAHAEMERIDGVTYDVVVMLQPTSPGRRPEHVTAALEHLVTGGFDSVWTLSETDSKAHPLKQLKISPTGSLSYYDPEGANIIARQQLGAVFHRNGIAYAINRQCLVGQKSIMGENPGAVITEGILPNIDTELDLDWANFLLARRRD